MIFCIGLYVVRPGHIRFKAEKFGNLKKNVEKVY